MPDAQKLRKLADLRRARGKSQKDAAIYFGLADSARNEISKWENGEKVPPPKYRARFIDYLCDFLNLGEDRERFDAVWTTLREEWDWDWPTAQELRQYFPPLSVAHVDKTTYESTQTREYRLLGIPLWSMYEYKGKREYRVLGMRVWSSVARARPPITLILIAVLAVALLLGISRWGWYYVAQPMRAQMTPPVAASVTIAWDLGEDTGQGAVYVGMCDDPSRNRDTSTGRCAKNNKVNSKVKTAGTITKTLEAGKPYRVCLAADDFPGKVGRWMACEEFTAQDGATYNFTMSDLKYVPSTP